MVYACLEKDEHTGEECCGFALCEDHFFADVHVKQLLKLKAVLRSFIMAYIVSYLAMVAAAALYVPSCARVSSSFARSTCMCIFRDCWTAPLEMKFAHDVIILTFGIAFPAGLFSP